MEQTSDLVYLGKEIDKESYKRELKNIIIDNQIQIDFAKRTLEIYEIKKSKKLERAHIYQLLYYLYSLKKKGVFVKGVLTYPLLKRKKEIELTQEKEKEIEEILKKINQVLSQSKPPPIEERAFCKNCSYYQLCYA